MTLAALSMITTLVAVATPSAHDQQATIAPTWFANANASSCNLSGSFATKDLNIVFNRSRARFGELVIHIVPRSAARTVQIDARTSGESINVTPHEGMYWVDGEQAEALRAMLAAGMPWGVTLTDAAGTQLAYFVTMDDSRAPLAAFDACADALVE